MTNSTGCSRTCSSPSSSTSSPRSAISSTLQARADPGGRLQLGADRAPQALHERTATAIEACLREQLEDHSASWRITTAAAPTSRRRFEYLQPGGAAGGAALGLCRGDQHARGRARSCSTTARRSPSALRAELELRTIENTVATVVYGLASARAQRAIERMCELGERLDETQCCSTGLVNLGTSYFPRGELCGRSSSASGASSWPRAATTLDARVRHLTRGVWRVRLRALRRGSSALPGSHPRIRAGEPTWLHRTVRSMV